MSAWPLPPGLFRPPYLRSRRDSGQPFRCSSLASCPQPRHGRLGACRLRPAGPTKKGLGRTATLALVARTPEPFSEIVADPLEAGADSGTDFKLFSPTCGRRPAHGAARAAALHPLLDHCQGLGSDAVRHNAGPD